MSAYHHVEDRTGYPAVLLETGMNDPRVDPWQMAKMTARLQAATTSGKPILLRVDYAGGHGTMGATRTQALEQFADEWSFLLWQFGVPEFQPPNRRAAPCTDTIVVAPPFRAFVTGDNYGDTANSLRSLSVCCVAGRNMRGQVSGIVSDAEQDS